MKLSYNWLKQFIKVKFTPEQLAEKLTLAGFEVEEINYGAKIKGVVVGEILSIRKHPKVKKLKILKVAIGRRKIKQIVCGASKIERGQKVAVALVGAEVIGLDVDKKPGKEPLVIQETEIRGVKSQGILCAEDELGIGDDHSGIYILSPENKVGQDINKVLDLDDVVFDLEIIPNRGDCLSILGLAREVTAVINNELKVASNKLISNFQFLISKQISNFQFPISNLKVEVKEPKLCPKYTARVIKNVKVEESPQWLKNRLRAVGIRSINNIVDITNYVMIELGQPLHAFDASRISTNDLRINTNKKEKRIIVRKARKGEKIITIDGKERELDETMLVIADSKKPIAVAGVMGGKDTEVTEKTTDIILESAQFDPTSIRKTARKLGLQSDSSYRFERGVDWNMVEMALDRATELIFNFQFSIFNEFPISNFQNKKNLIKSKKNKIEIGEKIIVQQQERYLRRVVKLPVEKVSEVLGVKISKQKIKDILESLGFKVTLWCHPKRALWGESRDSVEILVKEAKKLLGRPYRYGAKASEAPKKFDCSSLTQYLYKKIGITIPRCSIDQAEIGYEITKKYESMKITKLRKMLKSGDLIFGRGSSPHYSFNYPNGLGHVGIYIGQGKIVDADSEKKKVVKQTLEEFIRRKKWRGAKRILDKCQMSNVKCQMFITVPSWREDVSIPEDLIEEVGRVYDYNKLKPTTLRGETPCPKINRELAWENLIKDTLAAIGMTEVYNYSFYSHCHIQRALWGESRDPVVIDNNNLINKHLQVVNPINPDQEFLRISLIPQLLETVEKNSKNFEETKIFEMGKVYLANVYEFTTNPTNILPDERKMVAGIISQKPKVKNQKYLEETFYQIKGMVELLFDKLGIDRDKINYKSLTYAERNHTLYVIRYTLQKQKSAVVIIDNEVLGVIGETSAGLGLFEFDFQKLIKHTKERKEFQAISYYPAVERDLAIVVDKNIPYADLNKTIKKIDPLIKTIELFDIFESEKKLGKDKKSLAFHLKFQASDRTLRKEEVDIIFQNILKKLKEDFKAKIRTQ